MRVDYVPCNFCGAIVDKDSSDHICTTTDPQDAIVPEPSDEKKAFNRREVFEFCLWQLLDRYKEKAFKEIEIAKHNGALDDDWALEDCLAGDFTRALIRIGVLDFGEENHE